MSLRTGLGRGKVAAFANLWAGDGLTEGMRYADGAPKGITDQLFTELFLCDAAKG